MEDSFQVERLEVDRHSSLQRCAREKYRSNSGSFPQSSDFIRVGTPIAFAMVTGDVKTTAKASPRSDISTTGDAVHDVRTVAAIVLRHGLTALESTRRPSFWKTECSALTDPPLRVLDVSKCSRAAFAPLAAVTVVWAISIARAQTATANPQSRTPDFSVQIWGDIAEDFSERMWSYFALRHELEQGIPALIVTEDPAYIRRAELALAKKIRVARARAKQGDIFTPAISVEFRKILLHTMGAGTWAAIMDDNPGVFSTQINSTYSKKKPLSTVPPSVLAVLPSLPPDIQYRFVGRHLILHDTRANVILDRMPYAISCAHCDESGARR